MGILTDNSALNAWIIVGLAVATAAVLGTTGFLGLKAYQFLAGLGVPQSGTKLIYYIPVALLAFGAIADIISQTLKFSIGSLVGIVAMIANGLVGMGVPKGTPTTIVNAATQAVSTVAAAPAAVAEAATQAAETVADTVTDGSFRIPKVGEVASWLPDVPYAAPPPPPLPRTGGDPISNAALCSFPGLEKFDNKWAPQNILVVTAIMFYYMIGEWESGNANRTIAPGVALLATVLGQIGVRYTAGCLDPIWSPAVSIVAGAAFGIGGYHVVKAVSGSSTPFIQNQTDKTTPGGLSSVEAPVTDAAKPADGSKCAEASGDDFVCDLYKNGELITSTVSS
jgi:hypothetical protein